MNREGLNSKVEVHCGVCGLFLRFTDEDLGSEKRCPRCGAVLRLPGAENGIDEGLNFENNRFYVYDAAGRGDGSKTLRPLDPGDGPSVLYRCISCKNEYESLLFNQKHYNLCPLCKSPGLPVEEDERNFLDIV